jgi:hypothetical protein
MAYLVKHVYTGQYQTGEHQLKVQEALNQIGEAEIYSVQHSSAQSQSSIGLSEILSTLIIYREYEDTV